MHFNDTKVSRHNSPDLVKVEFVGDEDAVMVSMRGEGVNDLSDEQAVGRAKKVLSGLLGNEPTPSDDTMPAAGTDQTLAQP